MRDKEILTVKELKRRLAASNDDDREVHVQIDTLGVPIGPTPSVPLHGVFTGIDWDHGKLFLTTTTPVSRGGEDFVKERELARESARLLGWVYYIVTGSLPDKEKIKELRHLMIKGLSDREE